MIKEKRRGEKRRGEERRGEERGSSGCEAGVIERSSAYLLMCSVTSGDMTGDKYIVLCDSLNTADLDKNSFCCTTRDKIYSRMLKVGGGK